MFFSKAKCDNYVCEGIRDFRYGISADSTSNEIQLLLETLANRSGQIASGFGDIIQSGLKNFNFTNVGKTAGEGIWDLGSEITEGLIKISKNFSWKSLVHIGPYAIGVPLATLTARLALTYIYHLTKFNLGRPKLAIESYKVSIIPKFLRDSASKITSIFKSAQTQALFNNDLTKKFDHIIEGVKNTKKHNGFFQNVLLYGPPGTGKTMISKEIAKNTDMNYLFMSGGDLPQYIKRGEHVTELNNLITAAEKSSNPTVIFIDEAECLCRDRGVLSQELLELQNALLNRTSTQSKKFMIILATNRKDDLDSAILSRIDHKIHIEPPALKERISILQMYAKEIFKKNETNEFFTLDNCSKIALKTHGLTGRRLFKILSTISTRKFATKDNKLSNKLINEVVSEFINQERQYKGRLLSTRVNNLFMDMHSQIVSFMITIKSSFVGLLEARTIKKI